MRVPRVDEPEEAFQVPRLSGASAPSAARRPRVRVELQWRMLLVPLQACALPPGQACLAGGRFP